MKNTSLLRLLPLGLFAAGLSLVPPARAAESAPAPASIPFDQIGAHVQQTYSGDGLSITTTAEGARLRCDFQRLTGTLGAEGLWLRSTADNASGTPFRVRATAVGRAGSPLPAADGAHGVTRPTSADTYILGAVGGALPATGTVAASDKLARWVRPGLVEEFSVGVDGVRQDFVVAERPAGAGALRVELAVDGAQAEQTAAGVRLVLADGARKLAYGRLKVTDANGRELTARMEALPVGDEVTSLQSSPAGAGQGMSQRLLTSAATRGRLAVVVADAGAAYPVRIDPTFSDADWVSLNSGFAGANGGVNAVARDSSGNIYIGGAFTFAGAVPAANVAKWNGTTWSALGAGVDSQVQALAVDTTGNLYAGGYFTTAGGVTVNKVAKWNGSSWSALGTGMNAQVQALAVDGAGNLYAGGVFSTAGGVTVNSVAKWSNNSWSALGGGLSSSGFTEVRALAVDSTGKLYVGGSFNRAGALVVLNIAQWDGSAWSALGSGFSGAVGALAVGAGGTPLYAGGNFTLTGALVVNNVARADQG